MLQIIPSTEDNSVNFVRTNPSRGMFESRFVQRNSDHCIVYLSTLNGCDRACRMCHLTATGQNQNIKQATMNDMIIQAATVFDHIDTIDVNTNKVHFNFMARGEPLDNNIIQHNNQTLFENLSLMAEDRGLNPEFVISTIMPDGNIPQLHQMFTGKHKPRIYYSLYSLDHKFRKKWLPKAKHSQSALVEFARYQHANPEVRNKIHFAFIKGQNDSEESVAQIGKALNVLDLNGIGVNIVRYNPFSEKYGTESSEEVIERNVDILHGYIPKSNIKIIPRVGHDVKASCGMFVPKD
jgi:adenine C2-methylase RlmN of 23S rRNA A2503 and tRNA A37